MNKDEKAFVRNMLMSRIEWLRTALSQKRDIAVECDYPVGEQTAQYYFELFATEPYADRVTSMWADECWQVMPYVYEDEDEDTETDFEAAFKELDKKLQPERSYFEEESVDRGSAVYEALYRLDVLRRIGRYGVLLLGISDNKLLEEPATRGEWDLTYLSVFPEVLAPVLEVDNDRSSRRYGLPTYYQLQLDGGTEKVHWSRCVHSVANKLSSNVYGVSEMKSVLYPLLDIRKVRGGSAEMYWAGAFPGFAFESNPNLGTNVRFDDEELRAMVEEYRLGLQRYIRTVGFGVKGLSPQVVDPSSQIQVQLDAIAVQKNVPKRILMGSERGELSSTQDGVNWSKRVKAKRFRNTSPTILHPFFNRAVNLGLLPTPKQLYSDWPEDTAQTETERVTVLQGRVTALTSYISGGGDAIVPPKYYLTRYENFSSDEAETMLQEAEELAEKEAEEAAADAALAGDPASTEAGEGSQDGQDAKRAPAA